MDPEFNGDDVRKVIEKSTSKVSLRDLEKKGFRQVKVLRAGDINQLIFKAVQNVLAKTPRGTGLSDAERERIAKEAKAELDQQMAAMREMEAESKRIEADSQRIEAEKEQVQQAHKNLEAKLAEVNRQFAAEKQAFLREKQAFLGEKQQLFEKGLEGQQLAERKYESQVQDLQQRLQELQARLQRAESKADAADGMVSRDDYEALQQRIVSAETRAQGAEQRLRANDGAVPRDEHEHTLARAREEHESTLARLKAQHEKELAEVETRGQRYRRHADEVEEAEGKQRARAAALDDEVAKLKRALEEAEAQPATASGMGAVDSQELQRMRMEMEQRDSYMREMIGGLANTLVAAKNAPSDPADMSKHFKSLQQSLQDQLRKVAGSATSKGMGADYFELTAEHAAAIFAEQDAIKVETNIKDIAVREQSAAGVKDKLSKLKNLRGGNKS